MNLVPILLLLYISQSIRCESKREKEREILAHMLSPERYDPKLRPSGSNGSDSATIVKVNTFIRAISSIDDLKMEFSVQLTFRQQWTDERLRYDRNSTQIEFLTLTEPRHIWEPELFFSNEREGHFHEIMLPNLYYRISSDGQVLYSRRLSLTLGCPMNLRLYPFDQQICSIRMPSYAYTTKDLTFSWAGSDPVQIVRNLHLPRFSLQSFKTDYCTSATSTGNYSCLAISFVLKRDSFFYLVQVYIPSCMLVMLSWVTFWFPPTATQARMLLGLSTMFVLCIHSSIVNASIPQVSYTKSMDIWMGCCMTLIFAAFMEFVIVNYIHRTSSGNNTEELNNAEGQNEFSMKPLIDHSDKPSSEKCSVRKYLPEIKCCQHWFREQSNRAEAIDVLCRILFPAIYLLFCLIYWVSYAVRWGEL